MLFALQIQADLLAAALEEGRDGRGQVCSSDGFVGEWLTSDMSTLQSWHCFVPWNRKLLLTKKEWPTLTRWSEIHFVFGGHGKAQILSNPFFFWELILENFPSRLLWNTLCICIIFFFLSWVHLTSQHDQGRKCTHNRHCLAVKRQLSSLTVAEIALGYVWALYAIQWLGLSAGGDGRKWVGPNGHAACSCRGILGLLKTRATCQNQSMAKQIKRKEICPSALVWRLFLLFAAMWFDLRPGMAYTSRGKLKKDTARRLTRYMSRGKPKKDASRCLEHCTLQEES